MKPPAKLFKHTVKVAYTVENFHVFRIITTVVFILGLIGLFIYVVSAECKYNIKICTQVRFSAAK